MPDGNAIPEERMRSQRRKHIVDFSDGSRALLEAALELARADIPVFPCNSKKQPYISTGFHAATCDEAQIKLWWKKWPWALIGVPTGKASGLLVVDVDPRGVPWYLANRDKLKNPRIHHTMRGRHLVYLNPAAEIRCSAGRVAVGVDIRGEGGYVIWWPALGLEVERAGKSLSAPADWLLKAARAQRSSSAGHGRRVTEGHRNDMLSRHAYLLRRRGLDIEDIGEELLQLNKSNCAPPLPEEEVLRIAAGKAGIEPSEEWLEPMPLVADASDPISFPTSALGDILGGAVAAIAEVVQVPHALAAGSILAVASLAAQRVTDITMLNGEARPLSLFLITIAESGDRKSSSDRRALIPVSEFVRLLAKRHREGLTGRKVDESGYPARKPWLLVGDATPEGLQISLNDGEFAQGLFSDEGGTFVGGHAMTSEVRLRHIALLSKLWDGSPLDRVRAKDAEHTVLFGRRLTLHQMMQPIVARPFLSDPLFKGQGFLARVLLAAPTSLAGKRWFNDGAASPYAIRALRRFYGSVDRLLKMPLVVDSATGGLRLPALSIEGPAKKKLIKFYDELEAEQGADGALREVREWASKAAEHACRIAGVIAMLNDPKAASVGITCMEGGVATARFYLSEYQRLVGQAEIEIDIELAEKLRVWLRIKNITVFKLRDVLQRGPNSLRQRKIALRAIQLLTEYGWVWVLEGGRYETHPTLRSPD